MYLIYIQPRVELLNFICLSYIYQNVGNFRFRYEGKMPITMIFMFMSLYCELEKNPKRDLNLYYSSVNVNVMHL